jgi:hypothetical protein
MAGRTFPGRLSVAAPSDTPVALLAPILRSARIEGREHQTLLVRLPDRAANTCTLGTLARHPHYRELALPPETLESGVSTWGEVAARLDNASGPPAGSSR